MDKKVATIEDLNVDDYIWYESPASFYIQFGQVVGIETGTHRVCIRSFESYDGYNGGEERLGHIDRGAFHVLRLHHSDETAYREYEVNRQASVRRRMEELRNWEPPVEPEKTLCKICGGELRG